MKGVSASVIRLSDKCTYNNLYQIYTHRHTHWWFIQNVRVLFVIFLLSHRWLCWKKLKINSVDKVFRCYYTGDNFSVLIKTMFLSIRFTCISFLLFISINWAHVYKGLFTRQEIAVSWKFIKNQVMCRFCKFFKICETMAFLYPALQFLAV